MILTFYFYFEKKNIFNNPPNKFNAFFNFKKGKTEKKILFFKYK